MKNKLKKRFIIAFILIGIVILFQFVGIGDYIDLEYIAAHKDYLKQLVEHRYLFSIISFIAIYMVIVAFSIPITIPLNVAAGFFFGVIPGTIYNIIGATLGALTSFFIFRYLLRDYVVQRYGTALKEFNHQFQKHGGNYLLSLQLFPLTPYGIINILAGLSGISWLTFMWATALGILPGTLIYAFAGRQLITISSIEDIFGWQVILALSLLTLLSLVPIIYRFIKKK